jgi:hypothetical protein
MTTPSQSQIVPVDRLLAAALVSRAAWDEPAKGCEYCDHLCQPSQRKLIHSGVGGMGFDIPLEDAMRMVQASRAVGWNPHGFLDHNLIVLDEIGNRVVFEVPASVYEMTRTLHEMERGLR